MLKEKLFEALKEQVTFEFHSSYLYYSMANWAELNHWEGFAAWLNAQAVEEMNHAKMINNHLVDLGVAPDFKDIPGVKSSWEDLHHLFKEVLAHEKAVTARIRNCSKLAREADDNTTFDLMLFFEKEQIEEEKSADKILVSIERINKNPGLLISLDTRVMSFRNTATQPMARN